MSKLLLIALAGSLGTLARYGLGGLMHRLLPWPFPWGTLTVNLVGSFLFGLVWALAAERSIISGEARIIVLTGFMGAFTTFSTLMFESGELLRNSQWMLAVGNLALQNIAGLAAVFAGWALARAL
ncbi:MAG: fluoride efflux transporter CrcB [Desulfarculaceae bacterium]|nr:fluoride efflux transporter CrcB [Desulfarculaceae bacterium]MCF8071894.1 fluoride efflux transporter CrcB [Desulfarculaceae bacterium]MCF8101444.1 fluoride efflux transporter CrcB [Desulfarculaceae bacterium]MCF8114961.1 fluoride efflux transporter CrcB [Desulfarculaceae bacterium]